MTDNKMLQMILDKIVSLEKEMKNGFKEVKEEIIINRERINKIGANVAEIEDEYVLWEDFEKLDRRVGKVERKITSTTN